MSGRNVQKRKAAAIVLRGTDSTARPRVSRVALVCTTALPPVLLGAALLSLTAACMNTPALACALASSTAAALCLGGLGTENAADEKPRVPLPALVLAGIGLLAILAVPDARMGFFSFANGIISRIDTIFNLHIPYTAQASTCATSPVFGILLGVVAAAFAWLITNTGTAAATSLVAVAATTASMRLGLGAVHNGCILAIGASIACGRIRQLPARNTSLQALVLNVVACAVGCTALFALASACFSPIGELDDIHAAVVGAYTEARYGHDTLPQGSLAQATSMNTDVDGSGLTLSYTGASADNLYLRGYTGADFEDGAWAELDQAAYEGNWRGMGSWLQSRGLTASEQRSAYEAEALTAGTPSATGTATIEIDSSRANRRYVYAPYSLRELTGASLKSALEGSLSASVTPVSSYRETVDVIDRSRVLADTSWLANSQSTYTEAERVYAAFVEANYLEVDDAEQAALDKLVFTDSSWKTEDLTDYETVARVRTALSALASYTSSPEVPVQEDSFVQWFLGSAHAGNSAYFATTAVLALRSRGIPARYAEGYRASAAKLAKAAANKSKLKLTAKDAHAWAEVYLDGIGWTPVEVTPGFYTQAVDADQTVTVDQARDASGGEVLAEDSAREGAATQHANERDGTRGPKLDPLLCVATVGTIALLLLVCAGLVAIAQRMARIVQRKNLIDSDDQNVCVPALYGYLSEIMEECGIGFDEERPLDCLAAFDGAFDGIDAKEYRRAIELHQAFAFGGRELRPNELRTIRRFAERLQQALPAPENLRTLLHRRLAKAL